MRIGFAGLGRMGRPMAANLVRAGHEVTVWNRSAEKARDFAEEVGAGVADSPRALAEGAEVVVTMLADDAASQAAHLGAEGLFAADGGAEAFLEMGTLGPDHLAALREAAGPKRRVIDAPVSGATQAAADAALMIMLGGAEAEADEFAPVLGAMGREVIPLGARGAGAVMKIAVNAIIHGLNQTLAEALTLAESAGIAPERAYDAIEASAACAPMLRYRRPLYLDEGAHDVTFALSLARKDLDLALDLARRGGVAAPQTEATQARLRDAEAHGYGARDMAAIVNYMRKEGRG